MRLQTPITVNSFDREIATLRRPEVVTESKTFWRYEEPVLNEKTRQLEIGGFWPFQKKWWDLDTFCKLLITGYGGGKTVTLCKRVISSALANAPCMIALVSPTLRMAKRTTIRTLLELLEGRRRIYGSGFWYRHNKTTNEVLIRFRGRFATILILSAENPEHLKGPNLAAAYMDEPFIMHEDVFTQMVARVRHPEAELLEIGMAGCVKRSTKVVTRQGITTIGKLDPGTLPKQLVSLNMDVLGLNQQFHQATKFWNNGVEETRKIRVQNNYRLECTLKHPIWTMGRDGVPCWKKTRNLKVGDWAALSRGADVWGNVEPIADFKVIKSNRTVNLVKVEKMNNDFAYFLGLWTAEGSYDKAGQLRITCGDKDVTRTLMQKGVFGAKAIRKRSDQVAINSTELIQVMQHLKMPLVKAPKKWIADWVTQGRKEWALNFLAGMFDGDGHVCKDGAAIGYTTTSFRLVNDLQQVLMNLGCVSSVCKCKNAPSERVKVWSTAYYLTVRGSSAAKLATMLPLRIKRKRDSLALYKLERDGFDVPMQSQLILAAWGKRKRLRWRGWRKTIKHQSREPNQIIEGALKDKAITYAALQDFVALWDAMEGWTCPEIEALRKNCNDNYYWAKIKSLKEGRCSTVDFVVPDTNSFLSNSFVSHNTPEAMGWGYKLVKQKPIDGLDGMQDDLTVGVVHASTRDNKVLDPKYVKRLMSRLSPKAVEAYIDGQFVNLTEGRVYYTFDDTTHVEEREMPKHANLGCGMDFNVNPMAAIVFWEHNGHVHVIEEIELENSDTEQMAQELNSRWPKLIDVYPDPAGNQRKTSSPGGKTDFYYLRENGFTIHSPSGHYNMKDTWNIVNGRFRPGTGIDPKLTISKSCPNLIEYLNAYSHKLSPKQENMKHLLDALRYPLAHLFPLPTERVGTIRVSGV